MTPQPSSLLRRGGRGDDDAAAAGAGDDAAAEQELMDAQPVAKRARGTSDAADVVAARDDQQAAAALTTGAADGTPISSVQELREKQQEKQQQEPSNRAAPASLLESFGTTAAAVANAVLAGRLEWGSDATVAVDLLVRQLGSPDVEAACRAAAALVALVGDQPGLASTMLAARAPVAADALLVRAPLAAIEAVADLYISLADALRKESLEQLPPHADPDAVGAALAAAICSGDRGRLETACELALLLVGECEFKPGLLARHGAKGPLYAALAEAPPSHSVLSLIYSAESRLQTVSYHQPVLRALVGIVERANGGCGACVRMQAQAAEMVAWRLRYSGSGNAVAAQILDEELAVPIAEALCVDYTRGINDDDSLAPSLQLVLQGTAKLVPARAAEVVSAIADALHRHAARAPAKQEFVAARMRLFLRQPPFSLSLLAFDALYRAAAKGAALAREIAQREAMPLNLQQAVVGLAAHSRRGGGGGSDGGGRAGGGGDNGGGGGGS